MTTTEMAEPPDPTGDLAGIDRYIRRLYRQSWFPGVDNKGQVYIHPKAGMKGSQSAKHRIYKDGEPLKQHLDVFFPQGYVHNVTDPERRAEYHRKKDMKTNMQIEGTWNSIQAKIADLEHQLGSLK